ncbi:MAG TPA: polysaccharide deacetylase family protein [Candidatus Acidoferrum sp.]|nr:polysaccharide deacetylase family protein [Candidatus Acidoferrum sp.]
MTNNRCALRWLCLALVFCFSSRLTAAQKQHDVAITVDDLPAHGDLPSGLTRTDVAKSMVATFKAKGVPGVYGFVNAEKISDDADKSASLKLWVDAGFLLGSHTYSHLDLSTHNAEEFEADIAADEPALQSLMGTRDWHWFRYPFLHEGETLQKRHAVKKYLAEHGYKVAQVTLDFEDYAWNNPYARCVAKQDTEAIGWLKSSYLSTATEYITLGQQLASQIYGRDIKHVLVLHIGAFDSVMLPDLLDLLTKRGFRFVTLEEAQKDPAYRSDPDASLQYGGTLLEQLTESRHLKYPPFAQKPMEKLNAICRQP